MKLIMLSFFRKKTTLTYLKIYSLLFLGLFILITFCNILVNKENENYKGSFILLLSDDSSKLKDIKNIDEYKEALLYDDECILNIDTSLSDEEIIIPSFYKNKKEYIIDNDIYHIKSYSNTYNLFYISKNNYKKYSKFLNKVFIIYLKDNLKHEKTREDINTKYNLMITNYYKNAKDKYDFTNHIFVLRLLIIVLIILFSIVLLFTSYNIVMDEHNKNELYYRLGFKKNSLIIITCIKILSLLVISLLIGLVINELIILFNLYGLFIHS